MPISVVTGAAGFVGQALTRRLLDDGDVVRAVVLPGDPAAGEICADVPARERLEIVSGDVTRRDTIAGAFSGADRVFHAAALVHAWAPWQRFHAVNVGGTRNVAELAREHGASRFVFVSTSDVFGIPVAGELLDETSPYRRWNEPYADSKIEAETWLWTFSSRVGLPLSVIYPGWVYGPGDKAFLPSLARAIAGGSMIFWARDVRLPWIYIDNLVDACLLAATEPVATGRGYLVHEGIDGPSLEEVCARIAAVIGAEPPARHVPFAFAYSTAAALQAIWRVLRLSGPPPLLTVDVKAFGYQWRLSNRRAQEELGWRPRVALSVGMENALRDLCERWGRDR